MHKTTRRSWQFVMVGLMLVMSMVATVSVISADNHLPDNCVIPQSGPWPPCATGGSSANTSTSGCVIPPSGPWPPCATGGSGATTGSSGNSGCVIPPSGPWPPCATGGGSGTTTGSSGTSGCVIPPSGPWPPCATGGASSSSGNGSNSAESGNLVDSAQVIDYIPIYYVSNPAEILGVFPVALFDPALLVKAMRFNETKLVEMRSNLDAAAAGNPAACNRFENAYEDIKENALFFVDVPIDWQNYDFIYFVMFINSLDRTRPAYLSCFDSGRISTFNRDLALQTIDETLAELRPATEAAAAELGRR